jgi:hypothetical protein
MRAACKRLGSALIALLVTAGTPVAAQQTADGPIRLLPAAPPPASSAPAESTQAEEMPKVADEGVAVVELGRVDPSSVGLLTPESGGFGIDLWAGSRREVIERLIPRIPDFTPSRTAQALRRKLLLSAAFVPGGNAVAPSFLGLRVERLAAAGDYGAALSLAALASPQINDPVLDETKVDGALLAGDHQTACSVVEASLAAGRRTAYWVRALTFCRLLEGDAERARLTAAILRELPGETDTFFHELVAVLADKATAPLSEITEPTPLHLAMVRAARRALPDSAAGSHRPAVLRAVATSPNASIEARLAAGEAAEIVGVLPAESLGQIYASLAFSDDQRANALTEALRLPRSQANALLFQSAIAETIPGVQAEALQTAFRLSNSRTHGMLARVSADRLAAMVPSIDLMWFATDAGLAALHAGNSAAARAWFDLARHAVSESQADAAVAVLKLLPPLAVAQSPHDLPWVPSTVVDWWQGVARLGAEDTSAFGGSVLALLQAVGLEVPAEAWAGIIEVAEPELVERPSIAILQGLRDAAAGNRIGEVALLALVALGNKDPAEADTETLVTAVGALAVVGLTDEARGFAVEALIGRSL